MELFWRLCILPEILGWWYTRRLIVPVKMPEDGGIFVFVVLNPTRTSCSNSECPYKDFHIPCLGLESVTLPKTWYCPHCSRLPQFKRKRGKSHAQHKNQQNAFNKKAPLCDKVCVCEVKATSNDRLLECHSQRCSFSTLVVFD